MERKPLTSAAVMSTKASICANQPELASINAEPALPSAIASFCRAAGPTPPTLPATASIQRILAGSGTASGAATTAASKLWPRDALIDALVEYSRNVRASLCAPISRDHGAQRDVPVRIRALRAYFLPWVRMLCEKYACFPMRGGLSV